MRRLSRVTATAVILWSGAITAQAEGSPSAWKQSCNEGACLSTLILNSDDGRAAATLLIQVSKESTRFGAAVPLGVALEPGARLVVGARKIPLPFEVCYPDGCRAMTEVSGKDLDDLNAAPELSLQFFSVTQEAPLSLTFVGSGIRDAALAARNSLTAAN